MTGQPIAQIKAQGTESLWDFLAKLPTSMEAQVFYGLVLSGVVGLLASWAWKWSQGNADGVHHFTVRYVIGQALWLIGISIGAIFTLGFTTPDGVFVGWLFVLWTGGFAGFSGEIKVKTA